jgi:hypothetical protein
VHYTLSSLYLLKYQPSVCYNFQLLQSHFKMSQNHSLQNIFLMTQGGILFTNTVLRKWVLVSLLESNIFIKVTVFWNVMVCYLLPIYEITQCKIPGEVILIFIVLRISCLRSVHVAVTDYVLVLCMTYKHYFECHESQFFKYKYMFQNHRCLFLITWSKYSCIIKLSDRWQTCFSFQKTFVHILNSVYV